MTAWTCALHPHEPDNGPARAMRVCCRAYELALLASVCPTCNGTGRIVDGGSWDPDHSTWRQDHVTCPDCTQGVPVNRWDADKWKQMRAAWPPPDEDGEDR